MYDPEAIQRQICELYHQPVVDNEGDVVSYADWEERNKNRD